MNIEKVVPLNIARFSINFLYIFKSIAIVAQHTGYQPEQNKHKFNDENFTFGRYRNDIYC